MSSRVQIMDVLVCSCLGYQEGGNTVFNRPKQRLMGAILLNVVGGSSSMSTPINAAMSCFTDDELESIADLDRKFARSTVNCVSSHRPSLNQYTRPSTSIFLVHSLRR
ncbi:hypothetical protein PInf_016488 [Phytophthora infestans]|nr:hypothetical protein PInf_016488 [Phytophthora infestans]